MDLNDIPYKISFRKVRNSRLEFVTGELHLVLPYGTDPEAVFRRHRRWVKKRYDLIAESRKTGPPRGLFQRTDQDFQKRVLTFAKKASDELHVVVNKVGFRRMTTKWASCNSKGNININALMKDMPEELIGYVVYHEVVHLKHMGHNKKFWEIIAERFPHYEELEKELSIYWFCLNQ